MFKVRSLEDLVKATDIQPEEMVLDPWLPCQGLAMIAAWRGVGKTMLALGCALAIGSGTELLGWKAPKVRRVLFVDGEMALSQMRERTMALIYGNEAFVAGAENVTLLSHADQENGIPNLIRYSRSRKDIEEIMDQEDLEVLFLDNISSLCNSEDENDAASWVVIQDWLVRLRRIGKTVVLIHHARKPDDRGFVAQRGTSKKEDILNTTLLLRGDHHGGFLVLYDKCRGFEPRHEHRAKMTWTGNACRIMEQGGGVDMVRIGKELG